MAFSTKGIISNITWQWFEQIYCTKHLKMKLQNPEVPGELWQLPCIVHPFTIYHPMQGGGGLVTISADTGCGTRCTPWIGWSTNVHTWWDKKKITCNFPTVLIVQNQNMTTRWRNQLTKYLLSPRCMDIKKSLCAQLYVCLSLSHHDLRCASGCL